MDVVYKNSSYNLDFQGPSLQCLPAGPNVTRLVDDFANMLSTNKSTSDFDRNTTLVPTYLGIPTSMEYIYGGLNHTFNQCVIENDDCDSLFLNTSYFRLDEETWRCSMRLTNFSVTFRALEDQQTIDSNYSYSWLANGTEQNITNAFSFRPVTWSLMDLLRGAVGIDADLSASVCGCQSKNDYSCHCSGWKAQGNIGLFDTNINDSAAGGLLTAALNKTLSRIRSEHEDIWNQEFSASFSLNTEEQSLTRGLSLGALIEELSRNVTLSVFSKKEFW